MKIKQLQHLFLVFLKVYTYSNHSRVSSLTATFMSFHKNKHSFYVLIEPLILCKYALWKSLI